MPRKCPRDNMHSDHYQLNLSHILFLVMRHRDNRYGTNTGKVSSDLHHPERLSWCENDSACQHLLPTCILSHLRARKNQATRNKNQSSKDTVCTAKEHEPKGAMKILNCWEMTLYFISSVGTLTTGVTFFVLIVKAKAQNVRKKGVLWDLLLPQQHSQLSPETPSQVA